MTFQTTALFAACALALLHGPVHAQSMSKADFEVRKDRIAAEYKVDKTACGKLAGNAADICKAEAKGKEKVAHADLTCAYSGKSADRTKLLEAKAHAAYEVAEEKCDDQAGQAKDLCVQEAKSAKAKALADAKMGKDIHDARTDASKEKTDANYKVAAEKCDTLSGAGKADCVSAAKRQYGKN